MTDYHLSIFLEPYPHFADLLRVLKIVESRSCADWSVQASSDGTSCRVMVGPLSRQSMVELCQELDSLASFAFDCYEEFPRAWPVCS